MILQLKQSATADQQDIPQRNSLRQQASVIVKVWE